MLLQKHVLLTTYLMQPLLIWDQRYNPVKKRHPLLVKTNSHQRRQSRSFKKKKLLPLLLTYQTLRSKQKNKIQALKCIPNKPQEFYIIMCCIIIVISLRLLLSSSSSYYYIVIIDYITIIIIIIIVILLLLLLL